MLRIALLFITLLPVVSHGQDAKSILYQMIAKFKSIQDYQSDVNVKFDIPSMKMSPVSGKVYFKQPDKFKIKAKGILFLPKNNPMQQVQILINDTSSYNAFISGNEVINSVNTTQISIIPTKKVNDLVLGKFWIDPKSQLMIKSELTTKNGGTIVTLYTYKSAIKYGLPDALSISMDINKFKIPKVVALDIAKKKNQSNSKTEEAKINITLSNYIINKNFSNEVFTSADE